VAPRNARTEKVTDDSDERILARVRAGETRRFQELVLRYQDAIYG
jgi:hypothetical protein